VALLGPPNAGKSQLLRALTHARPEVADYPFTTRLPLPGMMAYENVQIQLVDLPAISPEFTETWIPQVVRNAHAAVLLVDVADPGVLDAVEFILHMLEERRLSPPLLLVGNKIDLPGAEGTFAALQDLYGSRFPSVAVSAGTGRNLDRFARAVFDLLGLVRVYTKAPGKKAELDSPFVTHRGATVQDAAKLVHKDFAEHLKFARLFRRNGSQDGLMVERHHLVEDEDILEFHI
jgi:small GTP-binding protein